MAMIRVLVVDDNQPFRQYLSHMLMERNNLRVICEASDGLEAVQRAEELQPDLVLLDVGLPKLNGFEAARLIRERSPKSKILFVSQESDVDIVQRALVTGSGYVVKRDAGHDLLRALRAVIRGEKFVAALRRRSLSLQV
jgi:DNA-binding NarL/FixJ family response regulator